MTTQKSMTQRSRNGAGPRIRRALSSVVLLGLLGGSTAVPIAATPTADARSSASARALEGQVHSSRLPVRRATIYAYQITDSSLSKAWTDAAGDFAFERLPAGLYKIIAHKPGFVPAIAILTRATAGVIQSLEFDLSEERFADGEEGDFWSIRERIPGDVLREIHIAEATASQEQYDSTQLAARASVFEADLKALTGVESIDGSSAQMTGGQVDLRGRLGALQMDIAGDFRELEARDLASSTDGLSLGTSSALSLQLASQKSKISVNGREHQGILGGLPSDLAQYGLSYQHAGARGESAFSAQYQSENNFYQDTDAARMTLPSGSTSLRLEGSYATPVSRNSSLTTGVRYRQQTASQLIGPFGLGVEAPFRRVELYSLGDWSIDRSKSLRYGIQTSYDEGNVYITPQGGFVIDLGANWTAETTASHRIETERDPFFRDFVPVVFTSESDCGYAELTCYKLKVTQQLNDNDTLSFAALHREFGDTLRLYFSSDLFDRVESLILVRGDEVPQFQMALSRRLGDSVLARLESTVAAGGGGILEGSNDEAFSNRVSYLITRLDTQFERSDTGLLVAFRRMEQELAPLDLLASGSVVAQELDRLQVVVKQGLPALTGLTTDWSLLLDMQLSRGSGYDFLPSEGVLRRVVGGVAVSF